MSEILILTRDVEGEFMITIFAVPRSFRGHFGLIQRNAIGSWLQMRPQPQILLMGNEDGTAEACAEFGVTHVPDIECNEYGTPIVSSMIRRAEECSHYELLLLVAMDLILFNDTVEAAVIVSKRFSASVLLHVVRRSTFVCHSTSQTPGGKMVYGNVSIMMYQMSLLQATTSSFQKGSGASFLRSLLVALLWIIGCSIALSP